MYCLLKNRNKIKTAILTNRRIVSIAVFNYLIIFSFFGTIIKSFLTYCKTMIKYIVTIYRTDRENFFLIYINMIYENNTLKRYIKVH